MTLQERLWLDVDTTDENVCWLWMGNKNWGGYGRISVKGRLTLVHRVAYELKRGPIPAAKKIDHLCRNRACINPKHLEVVTQAENIRRGQAAASKRAITHCPQGHPYDDENTLMWRGVRNCKACRAKRFKAWSDRK